MQNQSSASLFRIATQSDANVLILGATGTGKSTLAQKIHRESSRCGRPFVTVNLATVHEGTLESELFGHEKGAFTGAELRRVGKLESSHGGTVFLDEIGEIPTRLQARLLEFLHSRTISPVGSNREIRLDVRVIAATHRNLTVAVKDGTFREDLFHRLRVVSFHLQPLCARTEDFGDLVHQLLEEACKAFKKNILRISEEVAQRFEQYSWPGNIRELRNVLEFAVLSSDSVEITANHLPEWFLEEESSIRLIAAQLGTAELPLSLDFHETLERFEREYLRRALSRFRGRINLTARSTRINKTTLLRRIRAYGLGELIGVPTGDQIRNTL